MVVLPILIGLPAALGLIAGCAFDRIGPLLVALLVALIVLIFGGLALGSAGTLTMCGIHWQTLEKPGTTLWDMTCRSDSNTIGESFMAFAFGAWIIAVPCALVSSVIALLGRLTRHDHT